MGTRGKGRRKAVDWRDVSKAEIGNRNTVFALRKAIPAQVHENVSDSALQILLLHEHRTSYEQ